MSYKNTDFINLVVELQHSMLEKIIGRIKLALQSKVVNPDFACSSSGECGVNVIRDEDRIVMDVKVDFSKEDFDILRDTTNYPRINGQPLLLNLLCKTRFEVDTVVGLIELKPVRFTSCYVDRHGNSIPNPHLVVTFKF